MGKASKWILNLLIGKKSEALVNEPCQAITTRPSHTGSPKVKRRWSFGRTLHRVSKSVDLIDTSKLPLKPWQNHTVLVSAEVDIVAAATRIQAAFHDHLARKTLHALMGLVKLQALIRGHFVRKQTNATMRQMHALSAIQVPAQFQRVQMAEAAAQVDNKKQPSIKRASTHATEVYRKKVYMTSDESQRVAKTTNSNLNHSPTDERIGHSYTTFSSQRLSISNRHKYNETLLITPERKPIRPSIPFPQQDGLVEPTCLEYDYSLMLSYMANTQSSRDKKVKSQSKPKQRPHGSTKHKTRHTELIDSTDEQLLRRSSSHFKTNDHKTSIPGFPSSTEQGDCLRTTGMTILIRVIPAILNL